MVVNDKEVNVQYINHSAEEIIGVPKQQFLGKYIGETIKNTRLPEVLKHRRKEVNQKLFLENGKKVITTRIPIINPKKRLVGAFAVFKDITEVVNLAEEKTD